MKTLFGPELTDTGCVFRLWAPSASDLEVIFADGDAMPLMHDGAFWSARIAGRGPGTRYKFRIGDVTFPDPASRQQDGGSSGWSVVASPLPGRRPFQARPWHEAIICEVHIGTVSPEGTFDGLAKRLEHFVDAGYTALEIMPVNQFPGNRNWGYDGTLIFAPAQAYGSRECLRALVERAHDLGISMILDAVYNHFGENDNFIPHYAPEWFDRSIETPWGPGVNFEREMVRQFYYENVRMWLDVFDFDGLRFDAVHEIKTDARDVFLGDLAKVARSIKGEAKLVIENVENVALWLDRDTDNRPKNFTAQWNDDIHHVLHHLVTGERNFGYEERDRNPLADLEKGLRDGFIYDGEAPDADDSGPGPASRLPPDAFVSYVQNHDQIGNRPDNQRLPALIGADKLDFLHFVIMLAPQIPLFFMGEEAHLETQFPFFVDLNEAAAEAVRAQRYEQMRGMFNQDVEDGELPDPNAIDTFQRARIDWSDFERRKHQENLTRFRALAAWRKDNLWPLTATPYLETNSARQDSAILVSWTFATEVLTMALNASDHDAEIACVVTGEPIVTGSYVQHGDVLRLGAWSGVAWTWTQPAR